jgi:hypothetical protein
VLHRFFTQPKDRNKKVRYTSYLTVLILIALWPFMVSSTSFQTGANVTFQSTESPEFFAQIKVLSENSSSSAQKLTFIQSKALHRLFVDSGLSVSKKSVPESQLRIAVREKLLLLPLFQPNDIQASLQADKADVVISWLPEVINNQATARLQVLDKELSKYLHISSKSTDFEQLKRLMPALYNIEERHILLQLLKLNGVKAPPLKNSRLAVFLDEHISRLARGLTFNMKALVREGRGFESDLITSLKQYSLLFTAKPPDFILDYQLDSKGQDSVTGAWLFDARIALLAEFNIKIVSVELTLSETADNESQAQRQALAKMAESLSQKLRAFLLEQH